MRFHFKGSHAICNLCERKLQTVTRRDGGRILMCPGCGLTFRLTKRASLDNTLFPKRRKQRERRDDES